MKRFHSTRAAPLTSVHPSLEDAPGHTRRLLGVLFLFFLLLYALTAGGHAYSPQGRDAYDVGRSLLLDPRQTFAGDRYRDLEGWEIGLPLLMQPALLLGTVVEPLLPQKDTFRHEGRDYRVAAYPALAPRGAPGARDSVYIPLDEVRASGLVIFSYLADARALEDGMRVATITLDTVPTGRFYGQMLAGRDTADWAYDRPEMGGAVAHERANAAAGRIGLPRSHVYVSQLDFPQTLTVKSATIQYLADEGSLHITSLNLIDAGAGAPLLIGASGNVWSEQANSDFFIRLFALFTAAWVSALNAVLVFLITRRLGYHSQVALAVTMLYGLATLAWPYATYDFAEPGIALALLGTVYFLLRGLQERQVAWLPVAGCALFGGIAIEFTTALNLVVLAFVPALVSLQSAQHVLRRLAWAVTSAAAFLAPVAVLGAAALAVLALGFDAQPPAAGDLAERATAWLDLPLWIGLFGTLLSPGKSVLLYAPPLILALFGSLLFVGRHKWWTLPFIGIPLLYLLVYGGASDWYGGSGWGPRFLVPAVPLCLIMAAPILEKALFDNGVRELRAALALGAAGIGVQIIAVAKDFTAYFDLLRAQILPQIPENGAFLAGRVGQAYYALPTLDAMDKENVLSLFAAPFSPLFAHLWALAADAAKLFAPQADVSAALLGHPPWTLLGVAIWPQDPAFLLGLDFWSMALWREFNNHIFFLAVVLVLVLAMQGAVLYCWAWLCRHFELRLRLYWGGILGLAAFFILFDVAHVLQ